MSVPNPYKVLQVDPEAEDEVIEAAYRRLARKYHPDVADGPDAQDRMVRINQAWEMLRDPIRRAAVDRARPRAATTAARVGPQARPTADRAAQRSRRRATPPTAGPRAVHAPGRVGCRTRAAAVRGRSRDRHAGPPTGRRSRHDLDHRALDERRRLRPRTMGTPGARGAGPPPGNPSGSVLNFGRYAGWSLGEIARTDLEYLEWLDRMPIGRTYQAEIDGLLRSHGLRTSAAGTRPARAAGHLPPPLTALTRRLTTPRVAAGC